MNTTLKHLYNLIHVHFCTIPESFLSSQDVLSNVNELIDELEQGLQLKADVDSIYDK